ncbi:Protein SKT5 [Candida viswanathii]|uniref:Protein SKT5 n=1 Tax=Candida viswanathii TaxID=5486 RepID=A0A367XVM7_9ASCO|nr:Protein SKT5 [Candida viswanathii]
MSSHPYRQVSSAPYPIQDNFTQSDPSSSSSPSMTEVTSALEDLHLPPNKSYPPNSGVQNGHLQQPPQNGHRHHNGNHSHSHHHNGNGNNSNNNSQENIVVQTVNVPRQLIPLLPQQGSPKDYKQQYQQVSNSRKLLPHNQQHFSPTIRGYDAPYSPLVHEQIPQQNIRESPTLNATPIKSPPQMNAPYPVYESLTPPPVFASKESVVTSPPSVPLSATSSVTNLNLNQADMYQSKSENNLSVTNNKFGHNRSVSSTSSFFYDRNDNSSMIDFNQNVIQLYLGENSSHLMPRIKTLELYRKNARKSTDPNVLFQYAQYMLQTALLLETELQNMLANNSTNANIGGTTSSQSSGSQNGTNSPFTNRSIENSPRKGPLDFKNGGGHKKSKSIDFANIELEGNEKKLKKALLKEAVKYLKRLSDKGYVEAQYLLGDAYSSGALEKIDNKEAFILFQSAAKHGHVESAYRTSYCYEEGLGTGRDARKAVEFLKIAASKNHPAAMYKLGVYSFYGRMGLPSDMNTKKMGIKWLGRASNVATELTAAAPYELGKLYYNGFEDIVLQDKKYALELYAQAAALGHLESAAILGHHYEIGEIVPQDSNLSIHYYTQAALGGDPNSMLSMCAWYLVGSEPYLPKDENEAFEWAKRAAVCNLPKAQFALANFYEKGIGCIKNNSEAQAWYKKAAENGDEKSLQRITDKEMLRTIQKNLKNNPPTANSVNGGGSSAQDKDCVIM